jgi:hypothetical protein
VPQTNPTNEEIQQLNETGARKGVDRRKEDVAVSTDRRKVQRRRQIDPTTCERDYNQEEIDFMQALDNYKRQSGRMFPTCSEILEVIRGLGYHKVDPAEASLHLAEDLIHQAIEDETSEQLLDDEDDAFAFEDKEDSYFDN